MSESLFMGLFLARTLDFSGEGRVYFTLVSTVYK